MPEPPARLTVSARGRIKDIPAAEWDACAAPAPSGETNPFVTHAFLSALEESGAVSARAGWAPRHLIVEAEGRIIGVAPAYLKSHSMGEYVFDHAWADAFERAGGRYYPKLQIAVPFTPVPGPRLLVRFDALQIEVKTALVRGIEGLVETSGASSAHVTFLPEADWHWLGANGFLPRQDQQFHWTNQGYGSFADFLSTLASRKRKAILRERRDALSSGITVERLEGADIREEHWDAFFAFYMDTGSRKWGRPYLNRAFFSLLGERCRNAALLFMAKRAGRYIAGALNLKGSHALFGRNWGAIEHHPFLHFELCYYQAIEYAIETGLKRVEAGAQGEHKLARGYMPSPTYSAHLIVDPAFRRAVADYLAREREAVGQMMGELAELGPYKEKIGIT